MDRYLKCVICRYPCTGGQIYMSSQGLAIQIMSKDGYVIFLDCRARQLLHIWVCAGPAIYGTMRDITHTKYRFGHALICNKHL